MQSESYKTLEDNLKKMILEFLCVIVSLIFTICVPYLSSIVVNGD